MKKIILFAALVEISYLTLSFAIAELYGQWSILGELIRTGLRIIAILFLSFCYQKYFLPYREPSKAQDLLTSRFIAAIVLLMVFAATYTNAGNETVAWQIVFVISGIAAGIREELFYRGILQQALQIRFGYKTALTLATLLFTLAHIQYIYYSQFSGLALIAIAGIIFGCIYIYTGSIVFTAGIHALYDAVLSIDLLPFRPGNEIKIALLFLIMLVFLGLISKKLFPYQSNYTDSDNQDNLSMG